MHRVTQLIAGPLQLAERRGRPTIGALRPREAELPTRAAHALDPRVDVDQHALELDRAQGILGRAHVLGHLEDRVPLPHDPFRQLVRFGAEHPLVGGRGVEGRSQSLDHAFRHRPIEVRHRAQQLRGTTRVRTLPPDQPVEDRLEVALLALRDLVRQDQRPPECHLEVVAGILVVGTEPDCLPEPVRRFMERGEARLRPLLGIRAHHRREAEVVGRRITQLGIVRGIAPRRAERGRSRDGLAVRERCVPAIEARAGVLVSLGRRRRRVRAVRRERRVRRIGRRGRRGRVRVFARLGPRSATRREGRSRDDRSGADPCEQNIRGIPRACSRVRARPDQKDRRDQRDERDRHEELIGLVTDRAASFVDLAPGESRDVRVVDRREVEHPRPGGHVGAVGREGELPQEVPVQSADHRPFVPVANLHPRATLGIPDEDRASAFVPEADRDDLDPRLGGGLRGVDREGVVVLAVGDQDQRAL